MNKAAFLAVADVIEREERFNMDHVVLGGSLHDLPTNCGTVGCVAGWALALASMDGTAVDPGESWISDAAEILSITYAQADRLFFAHVDSVWATVADEFGWNRDPDDYMEGVGADQGSTSRHRSPSYRQRGDRPVIASLAVIFWGTIIAVALVFIGLFIAAFWRSRYLRVSPEPPLLTRPELHKALDDVGGLPWQHVALDRMLAGPARVKPPYPYDLSTIATRAFGPVDEIALGQSVALDALDTEVDR